MSAFLILLVIVLYSFQTLFCKLFTDKYPGKSELATPVFCVTEGIFITFLTFVFNGFGFNCSLSTLLLGVLNALMLLGYNISLINACKTGSYAFMNVCKPFGAIIIPALYGVIWLSESVSSFTYIGVGIMLFACLLMNIEDIKLKHTPFKYYVFCLLLFLFNGMYGTLVKMQSVINPAQKQEMIMITFFVMGIIAFVQLFSKEKKETFKAFRFDIKSAFPLIVCLISATLAINLFMHILPFVNTAVLYTVQNGGVLILSVIYSLIIFKEKLRPTKLAGALLAVISITLLSL